MKYTKALIIGFALFWMNNACAQYQNVMIGAEFGYSSSFLTGNPYYASTQSTTSYIGGAFIQYRVNKNFAIRGGLNYENKGAQNSFAITDINANYVGQGIDYSKFRYLVIPVLARLSLGNKVKGFFNAGPYLANLLIQNEIFTGPGISNYNRSYTNRYSRFDIGVSGGIGMGVAIGTSWFLSFELRNNFGITNVNKASSFGNTLRNVSYNALVSLGYKLQQ